MRLSGKLPNPDKDILMRNGLADRAPDFVDHPRERRLAIVVLSTTAVVEDIDSGQFEPVIGIDRIELIRPEDASTVEQCLLAALNARTHGMSLPVRVKDDVAEAAQDASVDHATGEIVASVLRNGKGLFTIGADGSLTPSIDSGHDSETPTGPDEDEVDLAPELETKAD